MHAITNNAIPNPNFGLSSSKAPDIIKINAKNPKTTGKICENIVVPTIDAIFYHYYKFTFFNYINLT